MLVQRFFVRMFLLLLALVLWSITPALAQEHPKAKAQEHPQEKMQKEAVSWSAEEIKWTELPNSGGIMAAELWGSMNKGAYGALVKLPAGLKNPLHTHTGDIKAVVISGTFLYAPEGGAEKKLGPGSYLFVPGGAKHTSGCAEGSPCVFFQEQSTAFDLKPVAASAPTKK